MPPKPFRFPALALLAAVITGTGCSSVVGAIRGDDIGAAWRGRAVAESRCAGCHAVGDRGQSLNANAPAFPVVSGRYSATALKRELEALSAVGHYRMPPIALTADERAALVAYMVSLKGREAP